MIFKQFQTWVVTDTSPLGKRIPPVVKYSMKSWPVEKVNATLHIGNQRDEATVGRVLTGALLLGTAGAVAGAVARKDTTPGRLVLDADGKQYTIEFKGKAQEAQDWVDTLNRLAGRGQESSVPKPPPPPPASPPAWANDPFGRHDLRWWDGKRWTENVSDADQQSIDPLT